MMFYSFDLDLDPITLILKLDLDMVKMYLQAKNEVLAVEVQKLEPEQTDRQTHTQTDRPE